MLPPTSQTKPLSLQLLEVGFAGVSVPKKRCTQNEVRGRKKFIYQQPFATFVNMI